MTIDIAGDLGGSQFRVRVLHSGTARADIVRDHALPPGDPYDFIAATLPGVLKEAEAGTGTRGELSVGRVVVGLSGLFGAADSRRTADALERLRARLTVRALAVTDDAVTAYLGALGSTPGVVLAAGTGAVGFGWDGGSRSARVDGWGLTGGDAGSGYWIGSRGAQAALRALDGRGEPTGLLDAFLARYGDAAEFGRSTALTTPPKSYVADFCLDVLELSEQGDPTAGRICDEAACSLVDTASTCAARAGIDDTDGFALAVTGRVVATPNDLVTRIRGHLHERLPRARWYEPLGEPLDGAAAATEGEFLLALADDPYVAIEGEF